MSGPKSWKAEVGILVLLIALAVAVRLPGVFSRSIWYDEGISLLQTAGHIEPVWPLSQSPAAVAKENLIGTPGLRTVYRDTRAWDVHPPAYFLALTAWRQGVGFSLETARWLSLIISLLSVVIFYRILRITGFEHPIGATVFYALSTGAVHHGHEARPYAMAEMLLLATWLAGVWLWKRSPMGRGPALVGSIFMAGCAGAAFATNYLVIFPLGALMGWFLWALWCRDRALGIGGPVLTALAIGGVMPVLREQLGAGHHHFSGFVGFLREAGVMILMNAQEMGIALSQGGAAHLRLGSSFQWELLLWR